MALDAVILGFCLLYALFGYFAGGLAQIVKLAALVLAYLGTLWSRPIVLGFVQEQLGQSREIAQFPALVAVWLVLYLILLFIGKLFVRTVHAGSETVEGWDRYLGFVLGLAKGALIVVLLFILFGLVKEQVYRYRPETLDLVRESLICQALERSAIGDRLTPDTARKLADLADASADKERKKSVMKDPAVKEITRSPAFRKVVENESLMEDIRGGRVWDVMRDPDFQALLTNDNIIKLLGNMKSPEASPDAAASVTGQRTEAGAATP